MTSATRKLRLPLLLFALVVIAVATLVPSSSNNSPGGLCLICGERGAADALLNVLLFMPFGIALRLYGIRLIVLGLIGIALALGIELAQFSLIPGRDASVADILFNTAGVVLGFLVTPWFDRLIYATPRTATRVVAVWTLLLALLSPLYVAGLAPSFEGRFYYPQWTPELGHDEEYAGELYGAAIDGIGIGAAPFPHTATFEQSLAHGTVDLHFVAAAPVPRRTTLFAVANEREQHLFRVVVLADDVLITWRTRSQDFRFDRPVFRIQNALAGLARGDSVHLVIERSRDAVQAIVNDRQMKEPIRISRAWTLLYFSVAVLGTVELISSIFLVLCLLPLAYWAAASGHRPWVIIPGLAAVLGLPLWYGLSPLSWAEVVVSCFALLLGWWMGKRLLAPASANPIH